MRSTYLRSGPSSPSGGMSSLSAGSMLRCLSPSQGELVGSFLPRLLPALLQVVMLQSLISVVACQGGLMGLPQIPPGGKLFLPLHQKPFNSTLRSMSPWAASNMSHPLRRGLVSSAGMWLYGHVVQTGYYYVKLQLGTPPNNFSLIVDTGSTVTYVPCSECLHCGSSHWDKPFNPKLSSTYEEVPCGSPGCPSHQCGERGRCLYDRHYAEDSSSSGVLVSDVVGFGRSAGPDLASRRPRILFGCEMAETGDLYKQHADGIVGLGRGELAIVNQLVASGAILDEFSLCFGGMRYGGGAMVLGATRMPSQMVFTSLDVTRSGTPYYNLILSDFRVGGHLLGLTVDTFGGSFGVVLDSGTTFSYIPSSAFNTLKDAIMRQVKLEQVQGGDPSYADVDICFKGAGNDPSDLHLHFPSIDLVFGDGAIYRLDSENYLFRHRKVEGAYCLGIFASSDEGTLLGGIMVRNTLVNYDRTKERVGFWKTDCNSIFDLLPDDEPAPPHSMPPGSTASPPPRRLRSPPPPPTPSPPLPPPPSLVPTPAHPPPTRRLASPHPPISKLRAPPPSSTAGFDSQSLEAPAPSPLGEGPQNATGANECRGCVGQVRVEMTLDAPFAEFSKMVDGFRADMARVVSVRTDQVVVDNITALQSVIAVLVKFHVAPPVNAGYLTAPVAEYIRSVLDSQSFELREAWSTYKVLSVSLVPLTPPTGSGQLSKAVIYGLVAAALTGLGLVLCLVILCITQCRRRIIIKYSNMDQIDDDMLPEEQQALHQTDEQL